ncbi:cytochrome C [Colwellia ponticola]|uniref:Cytochrome C n=1 Tax=Colwellia ponticola TaxID=2304625 RepID=A0A8H2JJR8_9GAMM|nr:cytochrome C [Colwellia ponticola]TMM43270.1 cytochrome C [Colwellia ponticola]
MKYSLLILISLMLVSCNEGVDSPRGFNLPHGDIDTGKIVFIKYQCLACHTLQGTEDISVEKNQDILVPLGGDKSQIITYAQLVTSIINPSHKFSKPYSAMSQTAEGESKMKIFNEVMTITELINLVSFLQSNYTLVPYQPTKYQYYPQ